MARRKSNNASRVDERTRAAVSPRRLDAVWTLATLVVVGIAVVVIYGRAIDAPLIFDDVPSVIENPSIMRLWPLVGSDAEPGPFNPPDYYPTCGRPLVNLTFALNYAIDGQRPRGYRLFNMALHVLSAVLLASIVRRTLRLDFFAGRFHAAAGPISAGVAILWAVHPLQTESVVYVTQRTELMVGLCYFVTLYSGLRYWAAETTRRRGLWMVLATGVCLAGMASKEVMVTAPVVVLLFERTFITGSFRLALQRSWPLYLGLSLGWVLLLALNYAGPRGDSAGFDVDLSAGTWWMIQAKVLLTYLKLVVWPWPLLIHYAMPAPPSIAEAFPWIAVAALLAIGTVVLFWQHKPLGFVGAWVLLILSPTLVVPIITEVAAERRMYLPLAGLIAWAVAAAYQLIEHAARRLVSHPRQAESPRWAAVLSLAAALVVAGIWGSASARRLETYDSELAIWQDAAFHQPNDHTAQDGLGMALLKLGRVPEALDQFDVALRLKPDDFNAQYHRANGLARAGLPQEAIQQFLRALQTKPDFAEAYTNLGALLLQMGQPQEALKYCSEAVRLKPEIAEGHSNLGGVLLQLGRPQEAIEELRLAVRLKPMFVEALNNLGAIHLNLGQYPEAADYFQRAIKIRPEYSDGLNNLGLALVKLNRPAEAVPHLELARRLQPEYAEAWGNLATALAQSGHIPEAITAAEQAWKLARNQGRTALRERVERQLAAYRAGGAVPSPAVPGPAMPPAGP